MKRGWTGAALLTRSLLVATLLIAAPAAASAGPRALASGAVASLPGSSAPHSERPARDSRISARQLPVRQLPTREFPARLVPTPIEVVRIAGPKAQKPTRPTLPFKTKARNAIILDTALKKPLFQLKADQPIPPASMTKLMTFLVAMQSVAEGDLKLKSRFWIGDRAASRPGSSMHLRKGQRPTLDQLLLGAMVVSGNDAATAVAQGVAGSEKAFVRRMNGAAKALGLNKSRFRNPTGFTAKGHHMSVRDLARLAEHLVAEYPSAQRYFTRRSFKWSGVAQRNRNPLLFADLSDIDVTVEGMKTGYTRAAGYCAVVSAVQRRKGAPPRRVIAVLAGLKSENARAREAERAVRWAFGEETRQASVPILPPRPARF